MCQSHCHRRKTLTILLVSTLPRRVSCFPLHRWFLAFAAGHSRFEEAGPPPKGAWPKKGAGEEEEAWPLQATLG